MKYTKVMKTSPATTNILPTSQQHLFFKVVTSIGKKVSNRLNVNSKSQCNLKTVEEKSLFQI